MANEYILYVHVITLQFTSECMDGIVVEDFGVTLGIFVLH